MPSRASTSLLRSTWVDAKRRTLCVSMPSRASTSLLPLIKPHLIDVLVVSMPSRASTSLLQAYTPFAFELKGLAVSMPSRASTSLLQEWAYDIYVTHEGVSMPSRASTSLLRYYDRYKVMDVACQCPLGLVPHCYALDALDIEERGIVVSMPSRASTSLLR